LLLKAADTREEDEIEAATARMERALRLKGGCDAARRRHHFATLSASSTCCASTATSAADAGDTTLIG
jgi:hypothetical protein